MTQEQVAKMKEISKKWNIDFKKINFVRCNMGFVKLVEQDSDPPFIDNSEEIKKVINSKTIYSMPIDKKTPFSHFYQTLGSIGRFVPHPIKKISFKLQTGEIITITDPFTIEGIRQGLEMNERLILKSESRKAKRPPSKIKPLFKESIQVIYAEAPDGSENSKYLFVGRIFSEMGYLKVFQQWDNDPGGYISHEDYLIDKIKNGLIK